MILQATVSVKNLLLVSALPLMFGCGDRRPSAVSTQKFTAVVTQSITLPDVPSGSAIHGADDSTFWIVSDDAPYLFRIAPEGRVLDSVHLHHLSTALHRIPKAEKPDYEAVVLAEVDGHQCLLAFGSGSHEAARDSMAVVPVRDALPHRVYGLTPFYERVRKTIDIPREAFNIEGAALDGSRLVLFNRGTAHLIYVNLRDFLKEVSAGEAGTTITAGRIEIPFTDSFPPGLSDGVFLDSKRLLFCASAEATTNWYADGEVLGSYLGLLDLENPAKPRLLSFSPLVGKDEKPVKEKLEGIDLVRDNSGKILEVIGVGDNDDGTSKLLHITYPL